MKNLVLTFAVVAMLTALTLTACGNNGNRNNGGTSTSAGMTTLINDARTRAGRGAFTTNATLSQVAQAQANYNFAQGTTGTTNGSGQNVAQQLSSSGYNASAQTVFTGKGSQGNAFNTFNAQNGGAFTGTAYSEIGVGTAGTGANQTWVVILAKPNNG